MTRTRIVLAALVGCVTAASPTLALNDQAVLVLHAAPFDARQSCSNYEIANFDCSSPATVSVGSAETIDAFLMVYEFDSVAGVQCLFDWAAGWIFQGWRPGCVANQVNGVAPSGGSEKNLATVFDVLTRPTRVAVVGWMTLTTGPSCCLQIGESTYPVGTHLVSGGNQTVTQIPGERRGSICSGQSGVDG